MDISQTSKDSLDSNCVGRLHKKHFANLQIASYRLSIGPEQNGANAKIISQRATKRFKVSIGKITEVLTLVAKEEGTLDPSEFRIHVDAGNVAKITNNSLTIGSSGKKYKYTH